MSDVNARETRKINSISDVIDSYAGAGSEIKTGVEIEIPFFDPKTPDLKFMSVAQNKVIKNALNAALGGEWIRNEPTSDVLETGSRACALADLRCVMDDINQKIALLRDKTRDLGLKRSYFQDLPERTAANLLQSVVDVPRYRAFFDPPRADMIDIAAYFAVCKSNQVSVSYKNPEHMLENIRRLYFLAPFLYLITDNSSAFNEGKPFAGHSGMHHRTALKGRGGVPPYVFTAKSGEEYIAAHIHHVMNNPLYVYYNEAGALEKLPSGTWWTFDKELRERGLNTATNFYFAETVLWPDVKIAALRNDAGEVYNHRYEARMFGVGVHQHQSALLIVAGLACNREFAARVDHLLACYGFDMADPEAAREYVRDSYESALHHNGKFLDIAFGNGHMLGFARAFADLLEQAFMTSGYDDELAPILGICRSGCTDAKINRLLFPDLESVLAQQRQYDDTIFDNPNRSARLIYEADIVKKTGHGCAQRLI